MVLEHFIDESAQDVDPMNDINRIQNSAKDVVALIHSGLRLCS